MRKISLIGIVMLIVSIPTFAGGVLTNTNQHVSFLRMLARGASIDIDGVYSNPAGLSFLPHDGLYLSLNGQSAYQTRNINATFPLFPEEGNTRYYEGTASAPFIPSVFAVYKKGDWTFSGSFAVVGGGGKASFDEGLPMFDSAVMAQIYSLTSGVVTPDMYNIASAMDGRQFIYGVQLGVSYQINDWLSVFAGGRMNYFTGGYEGYLQADLKSEYAAYGPALGLAEGNTTLTSIELDCDQTGWGLTPIIGVDAKLGKWNIAMKYEFMTNLNIENKTKKNSDPDGALAAFKDGVNTPSDIPALLTAAVGYEFLPTVRASVEYHHFFDKQAGMANDKQKALTHGTHEVLLGAEWDITRHVTISGGYQNTDYGLADDFQSDTSFSCDSYSLGFGAALKLSKHLKLNIAYFWTNYKDYTKASDSYNGITGMAGTDVYSRTNKVFGLGIDYQF
ncbi:MAG: hypothetical protein Q4D56_05160 [Bacteroides sp.]|nr:hypothetical protein [Bacteroides sp.]